MEKAENENGKLLWLRKKSSKNGAGIGLNVIINAKLSSSSS